MTDTPEPREVEWARPWRDGLDPPIRRMRVWRPRDAPRCALYTGGVWHPATITMRQDLADGRVIYHVEILLPGATSRVHRAVVWHPASVRPRD